MDKNYRVSFPKNKGGLGMLLGFDESVIDKGKEGAYPIDMNRGVYGLYIYTNIIMPQIVGDKFAPLLRVISNVDHNKSGQGIVKIFENPDYFPLTVNTIQSIEIDVRNDYGQRVKFQLGKTVVKLHFKQLKSESSTK